MVKKFPAGGLRYSCVRQTLAVPLDRPERKSQQKYVYILNDSVKGCRSADTEYEEITETKVLNEMETGHRWATKIPPVLGKAKSKTEKDSQEYILVELHCHRHQ